MYESINDELRNNFYDNPTIAMALKKYEDKVLAGKVDSFLAAEKLMELYKEQEEKSK